MAAEVQVAPGDSVDQWIEEPFNEPLVHQAVVSYQANKRADTASARNRADVAGRNQKPWQQKGTGRSRHGSRISPLWVGGGRAHAPDGSQDHSKDLTKTMKRKALRSALGQRCREEKILVLEPPELDSPSTSAMDELFSAAELDGNKILLALNSGDELLYLSSRNLDYCLPINVESLTTYHVVERERLVFTGESLASLKERLDNGVS